MLLAILGATSSMVLASNEFDGDEFAAAGQSDMVDPDQVEDGQSDYSYNDGDEYDDYNSEVMGNMVASDDVGEQDYDEA